MYKILVINLGSTSTNITYYEDEICKVKSNIEHPVEETHNSIILWSKINAVKII
jgi:butyrate kinase